MNKKFAYIGGDIMTHGSQLAREEECRKIDAANINLEYYSPARNKSINDKTSVTEEENNCLAERIVKADVDRLWNSDITVMCPEQNAIGTMCEAGILYGWKYMAEQIQNIIDFSVSNNLSKEESLKEIQSLLNKILSQENYFHYFDIRTNHLNEKDWRRSFSINQFLYGIILAASKDGILHNNFDEILEILKDY